MTQTVRTFDSFNFIFLGYKFKPLKNILSINIKIAAILLTFITIGLDLFLGIIALLNFPPSLIGGWSFLLFFRVLIFLIILFSMIFDHSYCSYDILMCTYGISLIIFYIYIFGILLLGFVLPFNYYFIIEKGTFDFYGLSILECELIYCSINLVLLILVFYNYWLIHSFCFSDIFIERGYIVLNQSLINTINEAIST